MEGFLINHFMALLKFAYVDVGKGREHMYSKYGIRAMHGAIAEDAEALPINLPSALIFITEPFNC